jgi:hypothetical protein
VNRALTLDWADGTYCFRLTFAGCIEVERKAGGGIQTIYERVMLGQAYATDVVEIIRQALLSGGGGTTDGQPVEPRTETVNALIKRYITGDDAPPFDASWNLAKAILHAFMVGYVDPQGAGAKKKPAADAPVTGST